MADAASLVSTDTSTDYSLERQELFHTQSQTLLSHIADTQRLLEDLRQTNRNRFPIQYPQHLWHSGELSASATASPQVPAASLGALDASSNALTDSVLTDDESVMSAALASTTSLPETSQSLKILKLDLRLAHRASSLTGSSLVSSLEQGSIANLMDEQLAQSLAHLSRLHARVADKTSRVLVTGDLNAGKSTLVNALLRKDVLPWDQQPCTMLFCEVLDAKENQGVEEIHALWDPPTYNPTDASTYHVIAPENLDDVVMDNVDNYQQLKIYTVDGNLDAKQSLLRNGVVDIALIDSPGLNRDSLKTTQLFTRQEEIDVIVFVVNSENHFTLSGQEFLQTAGKEKAYIFIVVNKFDNIRNKDRCRRLILEQIRDLSPRTYANAQDLVHFVSVAEVTRPLAGNGTEAAPVAIPPAFSHLEQSLRSFTLEKRFTSKLAPAQRYLMNLLDDIALLSRENLTLAAERIAYINQELKVAVPVYQNLLARRQVAVDRANRYLDASCEMVRQQTIQRLAAQLERFAQCQRSKYQAAHTKALPTSPSSETKALTPDATVSSPTDSASALSLVDAAEVNEHPDDLQTQVPWGGLLYTFQYIADLKRFLITRMEQELESCEMFTEAVVDKVTLQINDLHTDPMPRKPFYIPWDTIEQELTADGEFLDDSMTVASELATTTRGHHHSFVASPAALFDFSLGPSDFFHWSLKLDFSHLVAMTSASLGTLAMVFSRLPIISTGDLVHRAVQVGSTLGWRGMRHLTLVGGVMLGTGLFMFFTADLDRTIRVRVLERLRERIDDVHYVEQQSYILSQAANKAIRPFVWDVQSSFQRLIEHEEHERAKKLEKRYVAEESRDYFKALIQKSVILQQVVAGVTPVDQV